MPVDYREDAPVDEWSGDRGVGAQYFSQQAVGRLLAPAGIDLPADMPLPVKLEQVQKLAAAGDARALRIYEPSAFISATPSPLTRIFTTSATCWCWAACSPAQGGDLILEIARQVLRAEFPEIAERIRFHIPDEKEKRHGQAIAAASLPAIQAQENKTHAIS